MLKKDTKLRFWCQKVLPLVYDDSLSYYELLNKVVQHLNQHTEDINALIDFYDTFSEDVEEIIHQMMEDGEFNEIIADTIGSMIAEEYDPTKAYIIFDYCIYNSKLYRANASTTGEFDPEKWDERNVGYDLTTIQNYIYSLNAGNVSYDGTQNYENGTVGKEIKELNSLKNTLLVNTIDDLSTTLNKFVTFASDVTVGGIIIPKYAKGVLVTNNGTDASLYAIGLDGKLYTAFRSNDTWRYGVCVSNVINDLSTAITTINSDISYCKWVGNYDNTQSITSQVDTLPHSVGAYFGKVIYASATALPSETSGYIIAYPYNENYKRAYYFPIAVNDVSYMIEKRNGTWLDWIALPTANDIATINSQISTITGNISTIQGNISTINSNITSLQNTTNALNTAVTPQTVTPEVSTDVTLTNPKFFKINKLGVINTSLTLANSISSNVTFMSNLPRPASLTWVVLINTANNLSHPCYITSGGELKPSGAISAGEWIISACYVADFN